MAIAAVAHVFVLSVEPYRYIPITESPKVTTEKTVAKVKLEEGDKEKPAMVEKTDIKVEVPGTSISESVQDIIVEGGQRVSLHPTSCEILLFTQLLSQEIGLVSLDQCLVSCFIHLCEILFLCP